MATLGPFSHFVVKEHCASDNRVSQDLPGAPALVGGKGCWLPPHEAAQARGCVRYTGLSIDVQTPKQRRCDQAMLVRRE